MFVFMCVVCVTFELPAGTQSSRRSAERAN